MTDTPGQETPRVTLRVNDTDFWGWKTVDIQRGIEQIAGSFSLALAGDAKGLDGPLPIAMGDRCQVLVAGEVKIDGYVDDVDDSNDAASLSLSVTGRDRTADLCDCAARAAPPYELRGSDLLSIARKIAAPYGITVRADPGRGAKFQRFGVQIGETAFEAIEKMCRQRALLPISDGRGGLYLTTAGSGGEAAGEIVVGKNVLRASRKFSAQELFSEYVFLANQPGPSALDIFAPGGGRDPASVPIRSRARATDPSVKRYRPTVIMSEITPGGVSLQERAEWQRTVNAGRARTLTYAVPGWTANGKTWCENTMVRVTDKFRDLDKTELLITAVHFTLDEDSGGEVTELTLHPKGAFTRIPEGSPAMAAQSPLAIFGPGGGASRNEPAPE